MDDKTFDLQTALSWISSIEKSGKTMRDDDIYPLLNAWINQSTLKNVLDVGCGQGICAEKIISDDVEYTGVDPSPYLIERAESIYQKPNHHFKIGNAYELPFEDKRFDAAFSILVWHLLEFPEKAAQELARVLNQNGRFLIITANPNARTAWETMFTNIKSNGKKFEAMMPLADGSTSHDILYFHGEEELKEVLSRAGLIAGKIEYFRSAQSDPSQKIFMSIEGYKSA